MESPPEVICRLGEKDWVNFRMNVLYCVLPLLYYLCTMSCALSKYGYCLWHSFEHAAHHSSGLPGLHPSEATNHADHHTGHACRPRESFLCSSLNLNPPFRSEPHHSPPSDILELSTLIMTSQETVLITGCSDGGIGSALALVLQQRGLHVFATARDPSKMSNLSGLPHVTMLTLDVVKSVDIRTAVELVTKQTDGTLNYLISNAGRNHFMPILDEDLDVVRNLFEVNFYGPLAITQAFAPLLIKAKGMAVYITSVSGYINVPFMGKMSWAFPENYSPIELTDS